MHLLREQLMGEISLLWARVEEQLVIVHEQVEEMKEDWTLCKKATFGGMVATHPTPTIEALKLNSFAGVS